MIDTKRSTHQSLEREPTAGVLTIVEPRIRDHIALALDSVARPYHLDSVREALLAVRERPSQAVLLSQSAITPESLSLVGELAGRCAGAFVVILAGWAPHLTGVLLSLGRFGVREAVDVTTKEGLKRLRLLVLQPEWETAKRVHIAMREPLERASDEMRHFMLRLVALAPSTATVKRLARAAGVLQTSLNSRFLRAHLPSPKRYLASVRLLFAAAMFEEPDTSISDVSHRLNYSSPQTFGRHVREVLGMTGSEFRLGCSFTDLAAHFNLRFLERHAHTLRSFRPVTEKSIGW